MSPNEPMYRWRRLFALLIVFTMLLGGLPAVSGGNVARAQNAGGDIGEPPTLDGISLAGDETSAIELAATPLSVDLTSRTASRTFFNSHFIHQYPALNWTGNFANCVAGTISSAYKQAVIDQIAWYRVMAGVPGNISLSATTSAKAQQAALMMGKASQLSHHPAPSWPCYTADGAEAAANSNIAFAYVGDMPAPYDHVTQYMLDSGANNTPVGHRRWFLYPQTTTFGVGTAAVPNSWSFPSGNAVWVFDGNFGTPRPATRDGFVAWPPPGYVPYQVVFPRWSFSYPGASFSGATVSVTRNGSAVTASIEDRTSTGLGENTIVFLVGGASWHQPAADIRYTVTINNVSIAGTSQSFTYDVMVFNPAVAGGGTLPKVTLTPNSGGTGDAVNFAISGYPANSSVAITWKRSATNSINLGSVTTNGSGVASGSFTVPLVPGGVYPIVFASGSTSKQAIFQIPPRATLLTPSVTRNDEVRIQASGFGANQPYYVIWRHPVSGDRYLVADDLTMDANGQALVTLGVPFWVPPGPQELEIVGENPYMEVVVSGLLLTNNPPNAVAGGTTAYQANSWLTEVGLDGSASTGADGAIIIEWDWSIDGETISTFPMAATYLPVGTHEINLTVTDTWGLTDTDTLTVTITIAPQTAIANAGPDQYVASSAGSASVTLNGAGSIVAPGATIASYVWTRFGESEPIATGVSPSVILPVGTHEITLSVTSNFGITTTDRVTVVVGAPPVANAGPDQDFDTYSTSAPVTLNGSGSTPPAGHTITEYRWSGLPGGERTGANPTVTLPAGTYTATLTVTASNGMMASDTVSIRIVTIGAPTVQINPSRAAPVALITYEIGNFPRGSVVSISWVPSSGPTVSLGTVTIDSNGGATGQISVPAGPGGFGNFLRFTLGSVSVSAEVDVAPRISPSVTTAAPGQAITLNLRGFARQDPVQIRWKVGNTFVTLGSVTTSNTGSVTNFPVTIPANADGGLNTIRVQGTISQNSSTLTVVAPAVSITPDRTTVNNKITYSISHYPANSQVSITWVRLTGSTIDLGTVQTDATGSATGQITVPATPGGPGQQIRFTAAGLTRTVLFEVAPRIKVTPAPAARGATLDISLRGFARTEPVRIRWRANASSPWIEIAIGQTSNTGSANILFVVPNSWADGFYSMRAETASFNQQTNVVEIQGVISVATAEEPPDPQSPDESATTEIDRSALPLDAPLPLGQITDETGTLEIKRDLTDGDITTDWSGIPDPIREEARLTIDLGRNHALRGFGWLTETGGCGELTGLEVSLDGETWTAVDPWLQPGPIGAGMIWRYQATTLDARYLRITFAPENPAQTRVGCLAEVAVWGTPIVTEPEPVETPVAPEPTVEPVLTPEETPVEEEMPIETEPEPVPTEEPAEPSDE